MYVFYPTLATKTNHTVVEYSEVPYNQHMDVVISTLVNFVSFSFFSLVFLVLLITFVLLLKQYTDIDTIRKKAKNILGNDELAFIQVKIHSENDKKEGAMVTFLHSLHRVLPNGTHLSLEFFSNAQFLNFYVVVPKIYKNVVESQLYANYPDIELESITDYLPSFDSRVTFADLSFKKHSRFPLTTFHHMHDDILKNVSAVLSKTEKDEQVLFQFNLKRVDDKYLRRGYRALYYKYFGQKVDKENNPHPAYVKLSNDLYIGKIRAAYITQDHSGHQKLHTLLSLYESMKSGFNELKVRFRQYSSSYESLLKARVFHGGDLWDISEIATVYHFPYEGNVVANVVNTTSKRAPAPDILPREGRVDPKDVSFIGETNYRNEHFKFGIKRIDRRRHLYVVGKTGSGKSRLLQLLLISDIQQGKGCCLIDPHGDLADELLKYIPKERIKDVVYINPADRDFPIGFNPLEPVEDYEVRQHLSRFFIAIFKKLFAAEWNPRMEHLIRYITLALLETPDSNVLGIPRLLSDTKFRQRVIKQIQDPVVKSFWTNEFSASNEQFINAAAIPILNKVGQFISNPIVRNMVGQKKNMLDFDKFMNSEKIILINLSKGKLGDDNTALLGSMFITKIQQAALARAKMPEEERKDFYFYVDEFQNFATDAFSSILSEARKYRLDLTIAHQYIAQLPEDVKATAFGNVGTIITFAIGGDDAAYLSKEFSPTFTADDMINLNTREMYIKMSIDGKITPPFSAKTLNVPIASFDYTREIIEQTRHNYARSRVTVENEIARWSNNSESIESNSDDEGFPEPLI